MSTTILCPKCRKNPVKVSMNEFEPKEYLCDECKNGNVNAKKTEKMGIGISVEQSAEQIQAFGAKFKSENENRLKDLKSRCEAIQKGCQKVEKSWSGSFAGWHGRMYFGTFVPPMLNQRFNGEWGGLHGIQPGWFERSLEEVSTEIERVAGGVLLNQLETDIPQLRRDIESVRSEIGILLSVITFQKGFEGEKSIAEKIECFEFGQTKESLIRARMPKSMVSRDSEALRQGMVTPVHLYYEALADDGISLVNSIDELNVMADRFARQLILKINSMPTAQKFQNVPERSVMTNPVPNEKRKLCADAALKCHGTAYIFEKRSANIRWKLKWVVFLGLVGPATVGAILAAYKLDSPSIQLVLYGAGTIAIIQIIMSLWSLVSGWDRNLSDYLESKTANYRLSDQYAKLGNNTSLSGHDFEVEFQALDREAGLRADSDNKFDITDKEKHMGMRAGLREFQRACAGCKQVPTSMDPSDCDICGNF